MKVGYSFDHYSILRNIKNIVPDVEYKVVNDTFSRLKAIALRLNKFSNRDIVLIKNLSFQYYDFNLHNVDVIHFFNCVSLGKTPWVSTFETILRRFSDTITFNQQYEENLSRKYSRQTHRAIKAMAGEACIRLIALSTCAANIERLYLADFKEYQEAIEKKLVVIKESLSEEDHELFKQGTFDQRKIYKSQLNMEKDIRVRFSPRTNTDF